LLFPPFSPLALRQPASYDENDKPRGEIDMATSLSSSMFAALLDRAVANLRGAGIPATGEDIDTIADSGYPNVVAACMQVVDALTGEDIPSYLDLWAVDEEARSAAPTLAPQPAAPEQPTRAAQPPDASITIAGVAPMLRSRQLSPVELTEQALARIQERDPLLNAFQLVLAEEARAAAQRAEQEIAAGDYRGPLHGVPIAVKDLLAMAGTVTTAGSKVMAGRVTGYDAAAVERLHAAGAIIVGKTRLSEFAYWPGSTNPHYGPTRNPRHLEYDTGGSSSGSAAVVADGLVYASLGSDTGGSIRIPAAYCGLVGLKPTFGRISLYGCAPLAWSLDTLGPMTHSVADAALLLAVLAGYDGRDGRTRRGSEFATPEELAAGVQGLRIGVLRDDGTSEALATDEALTAWQAGLDGLARQGAVLVDLDLPEMEALRLLSGAMLALEAAACHTPLLRAHLEDYGEFCRGRLLRAFTFGPGDYIRVQQARHTLRQRWNALFGQIDLLSTPAQPHVAPALGQPGSNKFTIPINALGWPAISVPCGVNPSGLPLAIQLAGRPWDEATLLRAARAVEIEYESLWST
jgi:aspartyl-tRNA(Asn)/glutamyl-tRNA(Gln) amidotransferase subunit A